MANDFGKRLRELRLEAGLTQRTLADRAGFRTDAVSRWEAGLRVPTWLHVLALADALGVSTESFRAKAKAARKPRRGRPRKDKS